MTNQDTIARYKEIAAFLYMCLGTNVEIVVHDLTDLDHSVVAIHNNDISRRQIGAPLTDVALKILREKIYEHKPYVVNYSGLSQDGRRLRSSTFFIKNKKKQLIGLFCLNIDVSCHQRLLDELQSLFRTEAPAGTENTPRPTNGNGNGNGLGGDDAGYQEVFPSSVVDMIDIIAEKKIGGVATARLMPDEKIAVVEELFGQGVFMFKGSIPAAAERLQISEATVYRYLSKIKRRKNGDGVM